MPGEDKDSQAGSAEPDIRRTAQECSQNNGVETVCEQSTPDKREVHIVQKHMVELTRQQLYDEIREISVAGVAKKYNWERKV